MIATDDPWAGPAQGSSVAIMEQEGVFTWVRSLGKAGQERFTEGLGRAFGRVITLMSTNADSESGMKQLAIIYERGVHRNQATYRPVHVSATFGDPCVMSSALVMQRKDG